MPTIIAEPSNAPAAAYLRSGSATATVVHPYQPTAQIVLQGPQGPAGPAFSTYGHITYTDRVSGPEDVFLAGVRQQVKLGSSLTIENYLNPPYSSHAFLVNNRIMALAFADLYRLTVNLLVTAQQDDASLRVDIDVGSPLGPTGSSSQVLSQSAGTQERVTFPLIIRALANMMQNGAGIYLTSNVGCTIISESIVIEPSSSYAGGTP